MSFIYVCSLDWLCVGECAMGLTLFFLSELMSLAPVRKGGGFSSLA